MARDIDRKLRLTAALLGVVARKDLAAAFRRVNATTPFEIGRADKWLQGRSQPRELQVYEDWSKVLELDRPGQWIADCDTEVFLDAICVRHGRDREALLNAIESPGGRDLGVPGAAVARAGCGGAGAVSAAGAPASAASGSTTGSGWGSTAGAAAGTEATSVAGGAAASGAGPGTRLTA